MSAKPRERLPGVGAATLEREQPSALIPRVGVLRFRGFAPYASSQPPGQKNRPKTP